jgi:glycosyltransferase involved in cell wall biosynthesis
MSKATVQEKPKKALMICYYFPPLSIVGTFRSKKFVKYLGDFGWRSEVLTAYRGGAKEYENNQNVAIHSVLRVDPAQALGMLVSLTYLCINFIRKIPILLRVRPQKSNKSYAPDSNNVKRGLGIANRIRQWLFFPDSRIFWIFLALPKALWLARKCDIIYTSLSPYSINILGLIIKKLTGKPWVADYRDEWVLDSICWKPPTKLHAWLGEKLDRACIRNAEFVINTTGVRTQIFVDYFGGPEEKFITIHNGYDESDIAKFRDIDAPTDTFVMTSLGNLYSGRDAKPFLHAVAALIEDGVIERQKLKIKLIGSRNNELVPEVEKLGICNLVDTQPRIPQQEAFMELAKSHVAVLVGSDMEKVAMTTKVYEYAGMGKPIFALVPEGPVFDFVKACGGWCAHPANVEEIQQVLRNILDLHLKQPLANRLCEFVKKYDRRELTRQLSCCFNSCIMRKE